MDCYDIDLGLRRYFSLCNLSEAVFFLASIPMKNRKHLNKRSKDTRLCRDTPSTPKQGMPLSSMPDVKR